MPDTAAEQQAERFGMMLALTPVLAGFEALVAPDKSDADGDEPSHLIEATEVKLWLRRLNERLAMIGQGMHRFDEPVSAEGTGASPDFHGNPLEVPSVQEV